MQNIQFEKQSQNISKKKNVFLFLNLLALSLTYDSGMIIFTRINFCFGNFFIVAVFFRTLFSFHVHKTIFV